MKKIFKKNQVIITSLAILIAVAGYLNFADVDLGIGDKEASTDNSSILDQVEYDLSDETAVADENAETAAETAEVPDGSSTPESLPEMANCWRYDGKNTLEQRKKLLEKWGIPDNFVGIGHCILGYAKESAKGADERKKDYIRYIK